MTDGLEQILKDHREWLESNTKKGHRADMHGMDLRGTDFHGIDLSWVNLRGADLRGTNLCKVDLRWADARGVYFGRTKMSGIDLRWADIRWADFLYTDIHGIDFSTTDLYGVSFGETNVITLGPLGSRGDILVVKQFADKTTEAMTGCFRGTLNELAIAAKNTHLYHPRFLREYLAAIAYCRALWDMPVDS